MKKLSFFLFKLLVLLEATPLFSGHLSAPLVRKQILKNCAKIKTSLYEVERVKDTTIGGVPVRIYEPQEERESTHTAMMMHGGGWVFCSIDTHDNMARFLCQKGQIRVVSVDYSLAPEAKFPQGLEECYTVLTELSKEGDVSLIGDSAGGNFAAALSLMARDRGGPSIRQQIMINPALDIRPELDLGSLPKHIIDPDWYRDMYLNSLEETYNPYVSPAAASDLSNLPPALIILAEKDALRPSAEAFAVRIEARTFTQLGVGHLAIHAAQATETAHESLEVAARALREGVESVD